MSNLSLSQTSLAPGTFHFPKPSGEWISQAFSNPAPKKCVFRVDAGSIPGLSFGHLSRCLIVAKKLRKAFDSDITFIMRDYPDGVSFARKTNFSINIIPDSCVDEDDFIAAFVQMHQPDWLVVDLPYEIPFSYISGVQKPGCKVAFIDDWRFRNPGADVYINNSILSLERMPRTHGSGQSFLGPEYFIFDESQIDPERKPPSDHLEITISFGGADPTNLTAKVTESLLGMRNENCRFNLVLGPGYQHAREIKESIGCDGARFRTLISPENIIPIFQSSHLVVCAGGRTVYELLWLDKPFFAIASTPFEAQTIDKLVEVGAVRFGLSAFQQQRFLQCLSYLIDFIRG